MKPPSQRMPWLDWVRGAAAITMLQGHVFDSFLRKDLRGVGPFMFSQFAGGMPPAIFLFLLAMPYPFLMYILEPSSVPPLLRVLLSRRTALSPFTSPCPFPF